MPSFLAIHCEDGRLEFLLANKSARLQRWHLTRFSPFPCFIPAILLAWLDGLTLAGIFPKHTTDIKK